MIKNFLCSTALIACVLTISSPVLAQAEDLKKAKIDISVRDVSIAKISSFIRYIWQESPLIEEAEAKMKAAQAQAKADSQWIYNPEIEADFEDVDGEDRTSIFAISQTIDWSGKYIEARKVAKYELQAAIAELDNARQIIAVNVLAALSDYQASNEILQLSYRRTELMERFAMLAKNSFGAGDIDQSEYNLAQLAFSEALMQHANARATVGKNKAILESAIGFSSSNIAILPILPDELPNISVTAKSVEDIIKELPFIRILQAQGEAAKASIAKAKKERFADPTLNLRGGQDTGSNMIGMSLSIPLNILNTYKAEVNVAEYTTTAQERSLQSGFFAAKSSISSSRENYELSRRAWEAWNKNGLHALEQQINTLDKKFKIGELSATDYLVQIQQTLNTEIAAKELHNKTWKSWIAWIKASGNIENWLLVASD